MSAADDSKKMRIGWIGAGVMGLRMASHCINKGYSDFSVFSRTMSKVESLVGLGAKAYQSPKEVAMNSDIVFTIVGFPSDVRSVILDKESGVLNNLPEGGIVVDMTTSEPLLAQEIARAAQSQNKHALDAPVTGGDVGARKGTLTILAGGDADVLERVRPVLECFSGAIHHFGPAGTGQHAKAANQITICTTMIGMCEGLLYAHTAGLDVEAYLKAVSAGAAGSFSMTALAPRILAGDLNPGFYVEHFAKDLGIAVAEANRMGLGLPGLGLAHQLYLTLVASGDGKLGTQALIKALERMNSRSLLDRK